MSQRALFRTTVAGLNLLFISLIAISAVSQGRAQVAGATLSGTITDPSGAAIVGARVSIKNRATGVLRDAVTDSTGYYSAPNLLPGNYDVAVTAPGFSSTMESDVTLT